MSRNTRLWNQSPHYIAATQCVLHPGSMIFPRRVAQGPSDVTGFMFGQAEWGKDNLPDILYVLEPPPGWDGFRISTRPPQKKDADGNPMFERYARPAEPGKPAKPREPLLDFWILPDVIGTQEPWWYFEAIRRIDPRVRWTDITMRMPLEGRPSESSLNQDGVRNRPKYGMQSWFPKQIHQAYNARRDTVLAMLSPAQLAANTTRGTTPGLINPILGEAGGRVPPPVARKGQGVRRGPRKKAALTISDNEADDEESETEDNSDGVSDIEDSDSWAESVKPRVKPSKIIARRSKAEATEELEWVGDMLYDGRGLGKSKPPGYKQSTETLAQSCEGRKRKAEVEDWQDLELPPKKRVLDWLSITPLDSGSFQLPQNLVQDQLRGPVSHIPKSKPHHRYNWHSIEHASPYNTNSYTNFFQGLEWDSRPIFGVQSYDSGDKFQYKGHFIAASTFERAADLCPIDRREVTNAKPNHKRKRDEDCASDEASDQIMKRKKHDGAMGVESHPLDSRPDADDPPCIPTFREPAMVVLPPAPSNKRNRSRTNSILSFEGEDVLKPEKSKSAVDPVISRKVRRSDNRSDPRHNPGKSSKIKSFQNDYSIPTCPLLIARDGLRRAEADSRMSLDQSNRSHRLPLLDFTKQVLAGFAFEWQD